MSASPEAILNSTIAQGTAQLARALRRAAIQVREALTAPRLASRWLGTLTSPLTVGEMTGLDFGDGDFLAPDVTRMVPPHILQYALRYLPLGLPGTVTWSTVPTNDVPL